MLNEGIREKGSGRHISRLRDEESEFSIDRVGFGMAYYVNYEQIEIVTNLLSKFQEMIGYHAPISVV